MRSEAKKILERAIADGVFNCAVLGIIKTGEIIEPIALGTAAKGTISEFAVSQDSIFDVASLTKTVPVSTLALLALDRKKVSLSTPITELLPEYHSPSRSEICLKHLLTQTLDFDFALSELKHKDAIEIYRAIMTAELKKPAGTSYYYCNATSIILARVVEAIFENSLDVIAEQEIFSALGMRDTQFRPSAELKAKIVPTEIDQWRGRMIQGEIHDESSWKLNEIIIPGAAGIFSTVPDLQRYLKEILTEERGLFSTGFLDFAIKNHLDEKINDSAALGFELNQQYMGTLRGENTFGKTGFTGSVIVGDRKKRSGFALLTDYSYPTRKPNRDQINHLRSEIADLIWSGE
ncbi:MAG: beta-lactamase family protein [Chitinivibrionia bacterium]|nr:beta-lactamase family protein [Chitinivibrionia bacterium]